MCKPHWTEYTRALRKAALARKAADGGAATEVAPTESEPAAVPARKGVGGRKAKEARAPKPEPIRTRPARGRKTAGDPIVEAVDATIVPEGANVAEASTA